MADKLVRVCPKCKSTDISPTLSKEAYGQGALFNEYKCNKCGYVGQFFPEIPEKELKKQK